MSVKIYFVLISFVFALFLKINIRDESEKYNKDLKIANNSVYLHKKQVEQDSIKPCYLDSANIAKERNRLLEERIRVMQRKIRIEIDKQEKVRKEQP